MRNRLMWAGFGVLATVVGMAAGHLVASLLDPASSPVLAVGSTVIDLTPTPLKEWAIRQFGSNDKAVLTGSVLVGTLVLAAVAGLLARRRLALGAGLLLVLVAASATAALTQPEPGLVDVVPALATAVAGVGALAWLARAATPREGGGVESGDPVVHGATGSPTRRGVLVATGVLTVGAVAMGAAGRWITRARTAISDVVLPAAEDPAGPFPTGLEQKVDGISPFRTPVDDFYRVDTRLTLPVVDVDDYTLTIDGDVDQEVTFTFDDLAAMPLIERDITLTCVSNDVGGPYVGGARWLGVRLTDLLDKAGRRRPGRPDLLHRRRRHDDQRAPEARGRRPRRDGGDRHERRPAAARARLPGADGRARPLRVHQRLQVDDPHDADDVRRRDGVLDRPRLGDRRADQAGQPDRHPEVVRGDRRRRHRSSAASPGPSTAASPRSRCASTAAPGRRPGSGRRSADDYWRQWYLPWRAESGEHTLSVRATTQDGYTQTEARATPFPDGASGLQKIIVRVS